MRRPALYTDQPRNSFENVDQINKLFCRKRHARHLRNSSLQNYTSKVKTELMSSKQQQQIRKQKYLCRL